MIRVTGKIGKFAFQTLLVQLVSSLGLLAVAKFAVDTILQYVLPLRYIYRQYKTVKVSFFLAEAAHVSLPLFPADHLTERA